MGTHPIFESDFDCLTDCVKQTMSAKEDEVEQLSNKELKEKLSSMGINVGPIVDSTRKIYERKLAKLLSKGKETAYSTDEDGAPETPVVEDQKEEKKRPVR